jgi:hypothetical protein
MAPKMTTMGRKLSGELEFVEDVPAATREKAVNISPYSTLHASFRTSL